MGSPTQSWIVVRRDTGEAVMETFTRSVADAINRNFYDVLPAAVYLGRISAGRAMADR